MKKAARAARGFSTFRGHQRRQRSKPRATRVTTDEIYHESPVQIEPSTAPAAERAFPVNSQTKSAGDAKPEPAQELLPFGDLRHG